jgi:hypothetical protein
MEDFIFKALMGIQEETDEIEIEEKIYDEMPKVVKDWDLYDDDYSLRRNDSTKEFELKIKFNEMGMFGFVSWRWLKPFAKWIGDRKCLEVMAGRGWLSYGLRELHIDVIATDNFSWHKKDMYKSWNDTKTEVEELDAIESVNKYGAEIDILIMSWAYMDNTAYQTIKRLYEVNPNALVVFIGEGSGGCTADHEFFDHFQPITDEGFQEVEDNYQRWDGIHDEPQLGRYSEHKTYDEDDEE